MSYVIVVVIAGLIAGVLSGMFGVGGGVVIVPALILLLKLNQSEATATSLAALVPPVGLLGALEYYRTGNVNLKLAAIIAACLFVGCYFGAKMIVGMQPVIARRAYAVFLILVGARMFFEK